MNPQALNAYITTYSGKRFYPFDPKPEQIEIIDIAHALSRKGRWNDHTKFHYSVAAHSIQAGRRIENAGGGESLILAGLLHDASEAYFADVPTPIKRHMPAIQEMEGKIQRAVEQRFSLPKNFLEDQVVKTADKACLIFEAKTLLNRTPDWVDSYPEFEPAFLNIEQEKPTPDSPILAEEFGENSSQIFKLFLDRFFIFGGSHLL